MILLSLNTEMKRDRLPLFGACQLQEERKKRKMVVLRGTEEIKNEMAQN